MGPPGSWTSHPRCSSPLCRQSCSYTPGAPKCCNDGDFSLLLFQSVAAELLKHGHSVTTVKFQDTNLPPLPTSGHPNFTLVGAVIVIVMFKGLPRSTSASTTVSESCRSQRQENRRSSGFPSSSSGARDKICFGPSVSNQL